jgi:hypothetical protein
MEAEGEPDPKTFAESEKLVPEEMDVKFALILQ